jgi:anhydro-N-acetylmuramic acid kinase
VCLRNLEARVTNALGWRIPNLLAPMPTPALYLGLISGTSADGIDAALVEFDSFANASNLSDHSFAKPNKSNPFRVIAAHTFAFPARWRELTLALGQGQALVDLDTLGQLDVALGEAFADAALALLARAKVAPSAVRAIGSHGQTIRHRPQLAHPFSLQIGCPHVIAERTGIRVVADFRRRDIAAGGQGAPLVPAFHAGIFPAESAVLNLGGIANVTILPASGAVLGFDTGPANCLLDAHAQRAFGVPFDAGAAIAASGRVNSEFLAQLLAEPYFDQPAPKSTGREYFNLDWAQSRFDFRPLNPRDVQATLLELTARSVAQALTSFRMRGIWACGGGAHAPLLLERIGALTNVPVKSTAHCQLDPDFVEAAAFAWLAYETLAGRPGNRVEVTGAVGPRVLGAVIG